MMWKAARAANIPYHEAAMEALKRKSVDAHAALANMDRNQWTRCGFRSGSNCPMLVNNWAEAFNVVILKARSQPIITMLNTIHHLIMKRIQVQRKEKLKWRGAVCPRVHKLIEMREAKTRGYITRPAGGGKYGVEKEMHSFVVDARTRTCSCGLWQLGGVPCIHAICVYQCGNKDPRQFVHKDFLVETFMKTYSCYLEPIGGAAFWPKTNYDDILPPAIRKLPGRPKKCRRIDPQEKQDKADKAASKRGKRSAEVGDETFKKTRRGVVMHCTKCGGPNHNAKTCGKRKDPPDTQGSTSSRQSKKSKRK